MHPHPPILTPQPETPPPARRRRPWFFLFRLLILGSLVAGTAWLVKLNRAHDPRFYWFLDSPAGRWMSSILFTQGPLGRSAPQDGPLDETETQEAEALRTELAEAWPSHRVYLKDGRVLSGRVVQQGARELVFEDRAARAGAISTRWPLARVERVEPVAEAPPPVLNRDVRFKRQFPDLHYFRSPPFTLLTDQSVFDAEDAVKELRRLHQELAGIFAPLVTSTNLDDGIQLVVFSEEAAYREHCRAYAPMLEHSAGFFSPLTGRLALFNQRSSSEIASAKESLARQAESMGRQRLSPGQRSNLSSQVRAIQSRINQMADRASMETLRHEGAHQWFHLAGVHSRHHAENAWLAEGLAMWSESKPAGAFTPAIQRELAERRTLLDRLPWETLLAHRSPNGFFALQDESLTAVAYLRSWILVHWLMQPERRGAFFDYLAHIRARGNVQEVAKTPALDLLARKLNLAPARLVELVDAYERRLAAR